MYFLISDNKMKTIYLYTRKNAKKQMLNNHSVTLLEGCRVLNSLLKI